MKTNKEDIHALKSKHRLELVMQEAGESFEVDAKNPDQLHGLVTPGLTVDIHLQTYEFSRPGMDIERGDVIAWLRRRYAWDFGKAIKFLQNRAPDPKQAQVMKVKKKPIVIDHQQSDYVTISNIYTNPETGAQSYGIDYNYSIMDDWQKRALDLWHDAVKYFDKSSDEMLYKIQHYPKRFKPVIDFDIEKCANCEKPFNWKTAGIIAYAREDEKWIYVTASDDKDLEVDGFIQESEGGAIESLFIDADFVICEECLRGVYKPRYAALKLVYRSARSRKEAREAERKREREAERQWICEQQQLMNESELSP